MEDEGGAISQLGDLALGHILNDLGLKADGSGLQQLVGGKQTRPQQLLDQDQIYNEKFEDDDLDLGELPGADEEEHGHVNGSALRSAEQDRFYKLGMDALRKGKSKVRGEDDDFDEDGEGDVADADGEVDMSASTSAVAKLKTEPADLSMRSPSPSDPSLATPPALPEPQSLDVKELWPGFEPGKILNFTDLFTTRPPKRRRLAGRQSTFKAITEENLRPKTSTRDLLLDRNLTTTSRRRRGFVREILEDAQEEERRRNQEKENALHALSGANQMLDALSLDDWENRIVWQDDEGDAVQIDKPIVNINRPHNRELDGGEWLDEIIWDEDRREQKGPKLLLDLNDPEMLLETRGDVEEKTSSLVRSDAPAMTSKALRAAAGLDAFNLSNDRFYEQSREHRMRSIRQTLGQLELQHSRPATKLQMPFYKTRLSKSEARDFHRPVMHFPSNIPLRFTKVRKEKRSKEEARSRSKKDVSQVLKSTRDLTLKDTSSFVLYEYSEEYPPVLPNLGMGSLLVNYYRKKDGRDEHIPRLDLGEGVVLDVSDESPFMKFGSVEPGRTQPTLYNRMIRAPIFRHKAATTDFLLIRSITKNEVRYYLRDIRNLFVVGQTYPIVPVPGPHARLVTNALKYRMQLITYKLLQKSIGERIKIHRIMKYFPDQNELQMRQRMKEFMEYHRRDKDQGFWKLKPDHVPPTEADLQSKLTPEHVCLIEAMQAGQRHLLDAGYTKTAEGYEDENQDESKMDVEQLLAPWVTTKNFLHATQGKAMLKLYGDGDPSSRGEAFSFLRVSMKDIFIRAGETESERMAMQLMEEEKSGHKYNVARQQEVYKGEVQRIWNAQRRALENPTPPKLTQEEQDAAAAAEAEAAAAASGARNKTLQHARSHSRAESLRRDASPSGSQDGTPTGDDSESMADSGKVLRIRRFKMGRWVTEVVRETAVIHAYIRQRQRIEDERTATEALLPTGDAALDALRRKRLEDEIRSSLKNRDRRLQRKNAKALAEGLPIEGGPQALLNKTDTKRRCGRCGQVGHMSTNTSCPMFSAAQKDKSAEMALHGMTAGAGGAGAGAVPGALSGPGGHRPSMMGHQSSWFGASPNPSVPQSPMTPVAGAAPGALPSGYMTPGTPGGAQSPPATTAGSPAAAASAPSSGKIKLKIKR